MATRVLGAPRPVQREGSLPESLKYLKSGGVACLTSGKLPDAMIVSNQPTIGHCDNRLIMGPVRIRHSSHDFGWQSSHSVDLAGWQAKMASIEIWIP